VQEPSFDGVDLERHRVLDELAGYEDDDAEALDTLFQRSLYGDHPLARRPIGDAESIRSLEKADLERWHERAYAAPNVVLVAAGDVDHEELTRSAGSLWWRSGDALPGRRPPSPRSPQVAFERRDIGQFLILLGARAPSEAEPGYHALWLVVEALGAAASSRLWARLGEQLGLVYAVSAEHGGTPRHGHAVVSVAMQAPDLARALAEVRAELDRLVDDPLDAGELRRARAVARAELLLEPRSAAEEHDRIGRRAVAGLPLVTLADELNALDAVSVDDARLAARVFAPEALTIAGVGPDESAFRAAVDAAFGDLAQLTPSPSRTP